MSERSGSPRHLRRSVAQAFWPIPRKGYAWAVKPSPGPHPAATSVPIGVVLRDALRYAYTMREARRVLAERKVYIDWRVITDYKFPVGAMDVVYLKGAEEYYRVLPHPTKFLMLHRIDSAEAELKPLRVKRKVTVSGGQIQLTLHDGRTLLLTGEQASKLGGVRTLDTLLINLRTKSVLDHVEIREGVIAYVTEGRGVGFVGRVELIHQVLKRARAITTLRSEDGTVTRTILEYVFAIGRDRPLISIPSWEEVEEWERLLSRPSLI